MKLSFVILPAIVIIAFCILFYQQEKIIFQPYPLNQNYTYLANFFSEVEATTIEQN